MKKLAKKALQNKQTVKGYANCTAACQAACPSIPTQAMASSGAYGQKRG